MSKPKVIAVQPVDEGHQVLTVLREAPTHAHRKAPCPGCPWDKANDGSFPAKAFEHSARTAYDMSLNLFGCHESGKDKPATCAGFLLHGANHNLAVRVGYSTGILSNDVSDGGRELHKNYRSMAEANGVPADHESLKLCRD